MRLRRAAIAIATLLATGAAYAGTPGWSVSESSGKVSIISTGVAKVAVRGGSVATGDFVTTGANGRAVLVRGEEYLVVAPNSRIRVADPAQSGGMTQIIEHFGNVIYKIKKMTMPHFAVDTPFLAAVVKGTTFSVTVTEKGAAVQVVEGRVEVATRDGGAAFMVLPGDIGSVSAGAPGSLNVQGRENRTITSTVPAADAPKVEPVAASLEETPSGQPVKTAAADTVISVPVGEGPVRLDAVSDGLVKGDSSLAAIVAVAAPTAQPAPPAAEIEVAVNTVTTPGPTPVTTGTVSGTSGTTSAGTATVEPAPAAGAPVVVVAATPAPAPAPAAGAPVVVVAAPPAPADVVTPTPAPVVVAAAPPTPAPAAAPTPAPVAVVGATPAPAPTIPASVVAALSNALSAITQNAGNNSGPGNGNGNNGNGNGNGGPNGNFGHGNGQGNNGNGNGNGGPNGNSGPGNGQQNKSGQ